MQYSIPINCFQVDYCSVLYFIMIYHTYSIVIKHMQIK